MLFAVSIVTALCFSAFPNPASWLQCCLGSGQKSGLWLTEFDISVSPAAHPWCYLSPLKAVGEDCCWQRGWAEVTCAEMGPPLLSAAAPEPLTVLGLVLSKQGTRAMPTLLSKTTGCEVMIRESFWRAKCTALRLFRVISSSVTLGNHSRTTPTITEVVLLFIPCFSEQ